MTPMPPLLKIACAAMTVLFISWAAFQYNDPDPFIWILVYGIAALVSVLFLIKRLPLVFPIVFLAVTLVWGIYLSTGITYEPPLIQIEEWREMMGLFVVSIWMGFLAWMLRRMK